MGKDQKADDFLNEFKNLAMRTSYNDEALVDMLQTSLSEVPSLLEKILQLRTRPEGQKEMLHYQPQTLDEWYMTIGDFDCAWRQAHARKKQIQQQGKPTTYQSHQTRERPPPRQQDYAPPAGPPPNYRSAPAPPQGPAEQYAPHPRRPNQWAP